MVAYPPLNATCPQTDFENYAQVVGHIGSTEWFNAVFRLGFCGARSVPVLKEALGTLNRLAASNSSNTDYLNERSAVTGALERIGEEAKEAVPDLIAILEDEKLDEFLRRRAADALGEIGLEAKSAISSLHKLLESLGDSDSVVQVTKALGRIGETEFAVSTLLKTIKTTTTVRLGEKAALALAEIVPDTSGITGSLVEILQKGESNESRVSAALALSAIGIKSEDTSSTLAKILENEQNSAVSISTALALLTADGDKTAIVTAIVRSIDNLFNESVKWEYYDGGDPLLELQLTVARAVGSEMSVAVSALVNVLADKTKNLRMRERAIEILGAIGAGASGAVPALIEVVKYESQENDETEENYLRQIAISTLGKIGVEAREAVDELVQVVDNEQEELYIRSIAVTALGEIGADAKTAILTLFRILLESFLIREPNTDDSFAPKKFRILTAEALGKIGEVRASVDYLLKIVEDNGQFDNTVFLEDSDKFNTIKTVGLAFQGISLPAVPFLVTILKNSNQKRLTALIDSALQRRRAAAYGLAMLGQLPNEAIDILIAVANNQTEDLDVRRLAAYALENSGADVQEFFNTTNLTPANKAVCPDPPDFFDIYLGLCIVAPKNGGAALFEWIKKKLEKLRGSG